MTVGVSKIRKVASWAGRLVLSGVFIYAGAMKMHDPHGFAENVASFHLLSEGLVTPVTLTLPPLEILAALLALSAGLWRRAGAFCLLALLIVFTAALASALARGLQVDCGCFGADRLDILSPTKNLWFALSRDVALLGLAWFLYTDSQSQ